MLATYASLFSSQLAAKNWDETIVLVEKRAAEIWERGKSLGADTFLGTAVNEVDIPKHKCAILGRMLGHVGAVSELEEHPEPELSSDPTSEELYNLMVYSHSLSNWVFVARSATAQTKIQRKHSWNLDCVGQMGIPRNTYEEIAESSAEFVVDGTDLRVLGDIESGFTDKLVYQLDTNAQINRVVLGSRGGNVKEALLAGFEIRNRKLDTTLSSNCLSACPLVFLGGIRRTIWSPYPKLGFHQLSDKAGTPIKTSSNLYVAMERYAEAMGANPSFVLASMLRAGPSEVFEPDFDSLCTNKVVTWVQRLCF
jgi:hypothetical protein